MEDYGFEYSEEEEVQEDVQIENQYYNSKGQPLNLRDLATPSPHVTLHSVTAGLHQPAALCRSSGC